MDQIRGYCRTSGNYWRYHMAVDHAFSPLTFPQATPTPENTWPIETPTITPSETAIPEVTPTALPTPLEFQSVLS
jgi:hypothetical protein